MVDLYEIKDPSFLKELTIDELKELSEEIRSFLIKNISKTGGHLSSNLGVVELTIALHYVFDSPNDKLIFDVGHQSYVHKILTGRAKNFHSLRQYKGLSGYIKRSESVHDIYEAGHSSTSIAAAAGIEFSKKYNNSSYKVIPIIGDGALTGGMAFEALNFLGGHKDHQPIIILNDNEMSITENIGYLSRAFNQLRSKTSVRKIQSKVYKILPNFMKKLTSKVERGIKGFVSTNGLFDDFGFTYYGPINGHKFTELIKYLEVAKKSNKPCVIHVLTEKGKGYKHSEFDSLGKWHGVSPFDIETGRPVSEKEEHFISWSEVIANYMKHYAKNNKEFTIVVPAMIAGSALLDYQKEFPNQIIDVGIAEQMAVTMASGFAVSKCDVFVPIYSTFLQRAYDQVNHDVARQNLKVVFGVDRAGIVGADGETHQGIYDIPLMRHIPNMKIAHPRNPQEAYELLNYAFKGQDNPFIIRYERGNVYCDYREEITTKQATLSWDIIQEGKDITFISFGSILDKVIEESNKQNLSIEIVNAKFIKPIDEQMIHRILSKNTPVILYEESTKIGGFSSSILEYAVANKLDTSNITIMGINDNFIQHGSKNELLKELNLDVISIINKIKELL